LITGAFPQRRPPRLFLLRIGVCTLEFLPHPFTGVCSIARSRFDVLLIIQDVGAGRNNSRDNPRQVVPFGFLTLPLTRQERHGREATREMLESSGRLQKRTPKSIPIQVTSLQDPAVSERAVTENVSPLGLRVLVRHAKDLNEKIVIVSLVNNERTPARVVYCQRLPKGRYALGVEFQAALFDWPEGAAD